jgi:hypothetical protein
MLTGVGEREGDRVGFAFAAGDRGGGDLRGDGERGARSRYGERERDLLDSRLESSRLSSL